MSLTPPRGQAPALAQLASGVPNPNARCRRPPPPPPPAHTPQYAIQTGTHPAVTTARNVDRFRQQLKALGFSYDWGREISTTDPEYYR